MKIFITKTQIVLFLVLISTSISQAQTINLPNEAKFKMGDNMDWSNQAYNDNDWETKQLGKSWATTEVEKNVYAWYRIKIAIPSTMKTPNGKGIKLNLGKIDDVDQTYFNGKLVGQTGGFPPSYETKWDAERQYVLAQNTIQWDQENTIAVRIFSPDIAGFGMYTGPYSLEPIGWADAISVHQNIEETPNNGFVTRISFTNKTETPFEGTVKYWVSNKAKTVLFTETKPVRVYSRIGAETVVAFTNFESKSDDFVIVGYQINDNNSTLTSKNEQLYLANINIEIPVGKEPKPVVENKIKDTYASIPFENQKLEGYLGKRMAQNLEERLLKVDEEGLIGSYMQRPGIHPWAGEHVGKYLETACNVWKNTHDPRLKKQMDRMMYKLINTQLEDGYLGTYTPNDYWTSWDVWSHKYNLYGLLAYYETTGYEPALEACKKMGDLMCVTFGNNPGQRDIILAGEHKGMAATSILDPMVELYKYTGEKKYLDFCYYILDAWEHENGPKIISTLLSTGKVNKVANGKAYEMISNFVGLAKLYRVTGDEKLLKPIEIAWQDIVDNRLYVTGTTSSWEHFQDEDVLPAFDKDHMGEGCVTTTWIQFNQNLLDATGKTKYAEQIEKTIYNHLLAAENPETGCVSYYTPLMDKKPFICYISCCTSSVPRGIVMIPYFTFGNVKNVPTIMMYEAASYKEKITTLDKKNIDLSVQVNSNFPMNGEVTATVTTSETAIFSVGLRVPSWCNSFVAKVGNKEYKGKANEYLQINRLWKSGEKIAISFDMPIKTLNGGKSYPNEIAFQRGPQVLAFDSFLNTKSTLENEQKNMIYTFESKFTPNVLPKQWIGKQVYQVKIKNQEYINLVPYADASQTGGVVKVWLPLNASKK